MSLRSPPTSVWEWAVAGLGALIVVAVVGLLLRGVFAPQGVEGDVSLRVLSVDSGDAGTRVRFQAQSLSARAVSDFTVEGALALPDGGTELRTVTFDYLPGHARREGGLYFTHPGVNGPPTLRPTSYRLPE